MSTPPRRPRRSHRSLAHLSYALLLASSSTVVRGVSTEASSSLAARAAATDTPSFAGTAGEAVGGQADTRQARARAARSEDDGDDKLLKQVTPTSIRIASSAPGTAALSDSFLSTYDSLLANLESSAEALVSSSISPSLSRRLQGVPGTGISSSSEASSLQSYLDCTSSNGEWVYDPLGSHLLKHGSGLTVHKQEGRYASCEKRFYKGRDAGDEDGEWDVRESLKWHWTPSPRCVKFAPPSLSSYTSEVDPAPLSRTRLCKLLAHKSTLLLGDTTQYSLHDLILDWTIVEPQSCYGDLYCKEHALCGEILRKKDGRSTEQWEDDERVYHRLPQPPGVRKERQERGIHELDGEEKVGEKDVSHHPHDHGNVSLSKRQSSSAQSPSFGTMLRYRRTDGLRPATAYTLPTYKHPFTGIREINQQWLADSRRSDLVILTKPPLPLPLKGHNETWDEWVYDALETGDMSATEKAERLMQAAAHVTETVWLPELLEALKAIRAPPSPADQLVVYRLGWRTHPDCGASSLDTSEALPSSSPGDGPPPHVSLPDLASLFFRSSTSKLEKERHLHPTSLIFHNLQLHFQNLVARSIILKAFGIPYLDLETPLSIWRSGMVGSSAAAPFSPSPFSSSPEDARQIPFPAPGPGQGLRSPASGDCSRYCFPSPGMAVEEFFLGALRRVVEAGWAGSEERERDWVGDEGFRNLREREAEREQGRA